MPNVDVTQPLSVAQAIDLIDRFPASPRQMIPSSLEQIHGHVLQQAVVADRDYPPLDKSQVDGYAACAADLARPGTELTLIGSILAGQAWSKPLTNGECVLINTGAPVPPGADTCVPIENTQLLPGKRVRFLEPAPKGQFISPKASQCVAGQTLLTPGTRLGPAQLALCAQVGTSRPLVAMKPRVGVLTSGDEIVPYHQTPPSTQLRNANATLLGALLLKLDCTVERFEHTGDDPHALRVIIQRMFDSAEIDVLFITGGMSIGQRDHSATVLAELDFHTHIKKLRVKPGKPFLFASRIHKTGGTDHQQFVFGLPGNPVSAFVCTLVLASRLLTRLAGATPQSDLRTLTLSNPLPPNGPRQFYLPAFVAGQSVHALDWIDSADLATLCRANALIVRQENAPALNAGDVVEVLMLP